MTLEGKQHFTEPPLRYSEARLIKELEEKGIGRPSTYAMIIDTLAGPRLRDAGKKSSESQPHQGVRAQRARRDLTDQKLQEYFSSASSMCLYTAGMESHLDEIASGEAQQYRRAAAVLGRVRSAGAERL